MAGRYKAVISGSFRRYYNEVKEIIKEFNEFGVEVLSPKISDILNQMDEFIILESDGDKSEKEIEEAHLNKIDKSDLLYICNPSGYIGITTSLEIGYALHAKKRIFFREKPSDYTINLFAENIASPKEAVEKMDLEEIIKKNTRQTF